MSYRLSSARIAVLAFSVPMSMWMLIRHPFLEGVGFEACASAPIVLAYLVAVVSMPTNFGCCACGIVAAAWLLGRYTSQSYDSYTSELYAAIGAVIVTVVGLEHLWHRWAIRLPATLLPRLSGALGVVIGIKVLLDASTDHDGSMHMDISVTAFVLTTALAFRSMSAPARMAFVCLFLVFYLSDIIAFGPRDFFSALVTRHALDPSVRDIAVRDPAGFRAFEGRLAVVEREGFFEAFGFVFVIVTGIVAFVVGLLSRLLK